MSSYKLTYFNGRGTAEVTRMLFVMAGVEFEDCRITQEEFKEMKKDVTKVPMGLLPLLEMDGELFTQSKAIERYLARKFGLYGKNDMEALLIDEVCQTVHEDLGMPFGQMYFEKDEEKKKKLVEDYVSTKSVPFLNFLVSRLEKSGTGFFVGDSVTYADLIAICFFEYLPMFPGLLPKYPVIEEYIERIKKNDKLAAWIEKRPETPF